MLFLAICKDNPNGLELRLANRSAHLDFLNSLGTKVKIGGALLGPDFKTPGGSMLIYEAETQDDVMTLVASDPYAKAGLFETVTVTPWRQAIGHSLS
jgi:uncharacterized protein YciI